MQKPGMIKVIMFLLAECMLKFLFELIEVSILESQIKSCSIVFL